MKTTLTAGLAAALLLAGGMSSAQDSKAPPAKHSDHETQPISAGSADGKMRMMDEQMTKMQALHQQVAGATTPEERQNAMNAQRNEMQACMGMMGDVQGGASMRDVGGGKLAHKGKPADPQTQMRMMQSRMDMMQMMMQSVMDQQGMTEMPKHGK